MPGSCAAATGIAMPDALRRLVTCSCCNRAMALSVPYHDLVAWLVAESGMTRPMLHVHAGMAIYLGMQLALRTRRGSTLAWLAVFQVALFNEAMNRLYHGSWRWADTGEDLMLTLFWPTICLAVSKWRRWRWEQTAARFASAGRHRPMPGLVAQPAR